MALDPVNVFIVSLNSLFANSWSSRALPFTRAACIFKRMIPSTDAIVTWRITPELNAERTLHSDYRFSLCKL
ncbi:hypothetical protein C0J52_17979 [Blattella germanica]|nr:hypothetical protein C0J52_17979 [Blattella germanica]